MTKVLKIILNLPDGKTMTWTIADPIDNLTKATVETLINDMLNESMILVGNVEPTSFKKAYVYTTNTVELE